MAPKWDDKNPQPGDLIEIYRGLPVPYQHWALYEFDGHAIHLGGLPGEAPSTGSRGSQSLLQNRALVKKELLSDIVRDSEWKVNNLLDEKHHPLARYQILKRAWEMVGQVVPYSLTTFNCEHFVTALRYGIPESSQVREAVEWLKSLLNLMTGGLFGLLDWLAGWLKGWLKGT